ncbi:hypothetical protein GCM10008107_23060 [Psychrosphaera saromensis]|uniref:DUF11 domain-containing protein n=1 Tax=Psychrosphaera saromensis TaxID=716813 RepID=A0A2S7URI1_9GAMM|nr:FG-GAP-like repeat-containing protein [Psychrosphaera saromensis]PQJ52348.1 hypothetical protein BTO11_00900 [Psychrosphaera saromensis]GHB73029.1 hypothetical protein GCM10008107_23060 [Psychrosphaera saromensis]GLQ13491.1 hypothetical protein GCM10007917_09460 [Psychrosphaera saromensis]
MFNLTHNSKKKWLVSFALITSVGVIAASVTFSEGFSSDASIDTSKTTANLSTAKQALYLAGPRQQEQGLLDGNTLGFDSNSSDSDATTSITVADVDGDGDLDLVAGNNGQTNKLYLYNPGNNSFAAGTNIGSETDVTYHVVLADVNKDGYLDLVVSNSGETNKLYLYDSSASSFAATGSDIGNETDETWELALGDVDSDGDLDVVTANKGKTNKLYLNNGVGGFTVGTNIGSETDSSQTISLGDVDSDGDLDVVVGNKDQANKLYLNDGSGSFSTTGTAIDSDANDTVSVSLGDLDSDGDLDLLVSNYDATHKLHLNNGNGSFTATATAIGSGTDKTYLGVLADVDIDGDLDLMTANDSQTNTLYLNDGSGVFATGTAVGSNTDDTRSLALGDVDHDGDIDLMTGDYNQTNKLYRNESDRGLTSRGISFGTDTDSNISAASGDINNDGYVDIIVSSYYKRRIYFGNENGTFAETGTIIDTTEEESISIVLADVDGDANLDIIIGNKNETNKLFINDGNGGFPAVPTNISSDIDATLSIALADLDNDGDLDIVAANVNETNKAYFNDGSGGFSNTGVNISNDTDISVHVALVDVNVDGFIDVVIANNSETNKLYINDGSGGFSATATSIGTETDATGRVVFADMDNDGDLDLVTAEDRSTNKLYLNNGTGEFPTTGTSIGNDTAPTLGLKLFDIDNDGDIDVMTADPGEPNKIYLNDGSANFPTTGTAINIDTYGEEIELTNAITFADVDNDGDFDVFMANKDNSSTNRLYLTHTRGTFESRGTDISTQEDYSTALAYGDVNKDGYLDLVVGNTNNTNKLYLNDGSGNFPETGTSIGSETDNTNAIALADIDKDGDIDVIAGNAFGEASKVYLNDGTGGFSATGINIGDDTDDTSSIAVGDVDKDGDIDIVLGNLDLTVSNQLYRNDGSGGFPTRGRDIGGDYEATYAIVLEDINNDGYLDVVAGNSKDATNKTYMNDGTGDWPIIGTPINTNKDDTASLAFLDVDSDGDLDMVEGNYLDVNKLYLNAGNGTFAAGTNIGTELDETRTVVFMDVDNDGDKDLVVSNANQTNKIYLNDGSGAFSTTGIDIGDETDATRALALFDVDNDGDVDLVAGNNGQSNKLYKQAYYNTHANQVYSNKVNGTLVDVISVTLTATATTNTATTRNTSIDYYVSNNGGDKWYSVKSGTEFTFPETGTDDIRWRAQLNSLSPVISPVLSKVEMLHIVFPEITGVIYDILNGKLTVTGINFSDKTGATNDIDVSMFTFTGEASDSYTLTDSVDVDIASSTEFTLTLSETDKAEVNALINKNGTTSMDGTVYNLAAAEDWNAGAKTSLTIADSTITITASNLNGSSTPSVNGSSTSSVANLTVSAVATTPNNTSYDISYEITLTNSGDEAAENVQITTTIPEGVVLSVVPDNCELVGTLLTCTIASVEAGETVTITLALVGSANVNGAIVTSIVGADASSEASSASTTFNSVFKEVTVKAKSSGGSMPIMGLFGCLILLLIRKVKLTSISTATPTPIKKLMAAFLVLFATGVQAAETQSQSFKMSDLTIDLSLGTASSEVSNKSAEQGLANNSQEQNGISTDGSRFGYHAEIGYQIYSDWRVLAGYMDLGPATLTFNGVTSSVEDLVDALSELDMVSGKGLTASVEYTYQYKGANNYNLENWYLAPQVGLFSWNGEIGVDVGDESHTFKESDISLLYGLTLGYQLNNKASLGLRWLKTSVERDVNTVMLSVSYRL